ncbi:MBL fold metallo-hydrolase [Adhaeribacter sp. BT258]|uniref:MBL fold metallo-hydrolase n=1 Tax=Adhaeribacter terrigena TaxID=2793070 RepID=A0ABS1BZB7_9BACT|nr:MBL fold metallo-hydrolase [Adhaeribacter terrigena]MBK0402491.1 MBL fold metallo-hydrolase [Adhaeribacter terrigena]
MQLFITSLNSGSNGNCYYIGNETEAVLVDAGISCRETERRMVRLGLSMEKVKAIFISHEHSDHIRGLDVLSRKYQLPVYITPKTLRYSRLNLATELVQHFTAYESVQVGALTITGFPKFHDASDPHSFVIGNGHTNVGVFTDIGSCCTHVEKQFRQCHAIFLEANYDDDMLANGYYPAHLKKRISGKRGHLSNQQALDLFNLHKPGFMRLVLLSHLSRDNNDPQLVQELFSRHAAGAEIVVASRYNETPVYVVSAFPGDELPETVCFPAEKVKPKRNSKTRIKEPNPLQLALDF